MPVPKNHLRTLLRRLHALNASANATTHRPSRDALVDRLADTRPACWMARRENLPRPRLRLHHRHRSRTDRRRARRVDFPKARHCEPRDQLPIQPGSGPRWRHHNRSHRPPLQLRHLTHFLECGSLVYPEPRRAPAFALQPAAINPSTHHVPAAERHAEPACHRRAERGTASSFPPSPPPPLPLRRTFSSARRGRYPFFPSPSFLPPPDACQLPPSPLDRILPYTEW